MWSRIGWELRQGQVPHAGDAPERVGMTRVLRWVRLISLLVSLSFTGSHAGEAGVSQQQDNNPLKHDNKCWAEIYMNAEFDKNGLRLLLIGPHELATLKGLNDQNWDNDIESIIVGPEAMMTVYVDPEFAGRTLILAPNQTLGSLSDAQMKNDIESLRLFCK